MTNRTPPSAFGSGDHPYPDAVDLDAFPTEGTVQEQLWDALPEHLGAVVEGVRYELMIFSRLFYSTYTGPVAPATIFNQAANDVHDLLREVLEGHGRAATRTARALVEHLVNLTDVVRDSDAQERYEAHASIADEVEAEARIGLDRLPRSERRVEAHRLRKLLASSHAERERALQRYGAAFRRGWAKVSLKDRADRYGLADRYRYYRLASMVPHGALGGSRATIKIRDGRRVYRGGSALVLCPPAYHEGLRAFRDTIHVASDLVPQVSATSLIAGLEALLDMWPDYRRVVHRLDRQLWPAEGHQTGPWTVFAVSASGLRRWYYYDSDLGFVIEADPPATLDPGTACKLEFIVAHRRQVMDPVEDRWTTSFVEGVVVNPKPGARWINAAGILVPPSQMARRRLAEPTVIKATEDDHYSPT